MLKVPKEALSETVNVVAGCKAPEQGNNEPFKQLLREFAIPIQAVGRASALAAPINDLEIRDSRSRVRSPETSEKIRVRANPRTSSLRASAEVLRYCDAREFERVDDDLSFIEIAILISRVEDRFGTGDRLQDDRLLPD